MPRVEIYTTFLCGYCAAALRLLRDKGVAFEETDVTMDRQGRAAMAGRAGSGMVPQIFIDGAAIGGCNELYALERAGELDRLLGRAAAAVAEGRA